MKYRVILLTEQKEYIISVITAVFYALGNGIAVVFIRMGYNILAARLIIMIFLYLSYFCIGLFCRRTYGFVQFKGKPLFNEIRGSKNVMVLKLTSMLYSSVPIVLISTLPDGGALLASVYAVYRNVIIFVQNCLTSITNAPRLGFGSLLAEGNHKEAEDLFNLYEKITFIGMSIILGTTCLLIMSFVDMYTMGITDINYHNVMLACIMLVTVFFEVCHIPSGQIIQMSGSFEASKHIQTIAFIVLAVGMVLGRALIGFYGILLSVLLAAIILCVLEIGYTGTKIFKRSWLSFIGNMLPCLVICVASGWIGFSGIIVCDSYLLFTIEGVVSVIILFVITIVIYYLIDPASVRRILSIVKGFLKRE